MSVEDRGDAVRAGETLDATAVTRWLQGQGVALSGTPDVTQFSGGASNWTYRLRYANRDLILRRPPSGTKARGAHDMGREFRVQSALKPVYPCVPAMVGLCRDESVIGSEFYVMDRLAGVIPRKNLPPGLTLTREQTRRLCTNMLEKLIELHSVDVCSAGLDSLGKGQGYVRRQVEGWAERYARAHTWNVPKALKIIAWLRANQPPGESRICLIHNDWRFDNLVLSSDDPTQVIGVLDWEMATLGDPLMDFGNVITYWTEAGDDRVAQWMRRQPSHLPGMFTRREAIDYYLRRTGLSTQHWAFYEAFGLFRLAVIAQQIYFRYHHRQTRNPVFRHYWLMVHYLLRRSLKATRPDAR